MSIKKYTNGAFVDVGYKRYETSTDTITTLPQDIIADSVSAINIKGNMEQSGTPSPSSIIMPQECGERTENLFDESLIQNGYYGSSGSISTFTIDNRYRAFTMAIKAGTYTIKIQADEGIRLLRIATTNEFYNVQEDNKAYTFVISADATMYVSWRNLQVTNSFTNMTVMLNTGSTALPYESYGFKIPILSASTTTNVYLGEVQSTRQIKKLVLTGEEDWKYSTSSQAHWVANVPNDYDNTLSSQITTVCTHYKCIRNDAGLIGMVNGDLRLYAKSTSPVAHELYIKDTTYTSAADFKAYLAQQYANGTPVTVWYVLATPTTGIVNEPLRKIGNYADSITGLTIPTTGTAEQFDIDTTLKPSEVELTYTGWHSKTDTKF